MRADVPIAKDSECLAVNSEYSNTRQICAGGQKGNFRPVDTYNLSHNSSWAELVSESMFLKVCIVLLENNKQQWHFKTLDFVDRWSLSEVFI